MPHPLPGRANLNGADSASRQSLPGRRGPLVARTVAGLGVLVLPCLARVAPRFALAQAAPSGSVGLALKAIAQSRPGAQTALTEPAAGAEIHLDPPSVSFQDRSKVRDFNISINYPRSPETAPAVEMVLDVGRGEPRTFAAIPAAAPGRYIVSAPLVPEYLHPRRLKIRARYPNGSVTCTVEDTDLELTGRPLQLSDVKSFRGGKIPTLILRNGESVQALPAPLQNMRADLGPIALTLNLASSDEFDVQPVAASPQMVHYKVLVKVRDQVVGETSGVIAVRGAPGPDHPDSDK